MLQIAQAWGSPPDRTVIASHWD